MTHWSETFPWTASVVRFFWPDGPARRKRWVKIAIVVVAIAAAHAAITAFAAFRMGRAEDQFVSRWGAMRVTMHAPPKVDDAKNAARAVRAAVEMMSLPEKGAGSALAYERFATGPEETFTAADKDSVRKLIADNALTFSILDVATLRPESSWDLHYERGIELEIPPLLRLMHLSKLNAAAGRLALEDGRVDDAMTALRRGRTISASLDREPILIVQLVRLAVERIHERLLRRILGTAELDQRRLDELRTLFSDTQARKALQRAMIVETKAVDEIYRTGTGASTFLSTRPSLAKAVSLSVARGLASPYLLRERRLCLESMASNVTRLDQPRHARAAGHDAPQLRRWDVLARILLRNLGGAIDRVDLEEIRSALATTAIAIESRRVASGRPPATLDELVPELLPAVPLDPWTGRPFRYESTGTTWSLKSEADLTAVESAKIVEPVVAWGRPPTN